MLQDGDENINKQQVIQENLKSLAINSQKKRVAQAHYYGETGRSPLIRSVANNSGDNRQPVHARLGTGKIRLKRMFNYNDNNNTNGIVLHSKMFRNKNRNDFKYNSPNRTTLFKKSSAQIRLQRIRQQRLNNNTMPMSGPQKIRLRRRRPGMSLLQTQPVNYTVQVDNTSPANQLYNFKHSIQAQLNKQLQAEIRMIQAQNPHEPQMIPSVPIHAIGYGFTNKTLNNRFSSL